MMKFHVVIRLDRFPLGTAAAIQKENKKTKSLQNGIGARLLSIKIRDFLLFKSGSVVESLIAYFL